VHRVQQDAARARLFPVLGQDAHLMGWCVSGAGCVGGVGGGGHVNKLSTTGQCAGDAVRPTHMWVGWRPPVPPAQAQPQSTVATHQLLQDSGILLRQLLLLLRRRRRAAARVHVAHQRTA
jgi:hypothetical protein